jgi:hypothetical protein
MELCRWTDVSGGFCIVTGGNDDSENGESDGDVHVCQEVIYVVFLLEWGGVALTVVFMEAVCPPEATMPHFDTKNT